MRIFYSFLVVLVSAVLALLPITQGIYDFQTDQREDNFTVTTGAVTNTTVQLFTTLYDNDTSTIEILSHDSDDSPLYNSYNTTTRALLITGLAENTTRTIDVTYDVNALGDSSGISTFVGYLAYIWIIIWVAFPIAALIAIWTGRV